MRRLAWLGTLMCALTGCECSTQPTPVDAGDSAIAREDASARDAGRDAARDAGRDAGPDAFVIGDAGPLECRRLCGSPRPFADGDIAELRIADDGDARNVDVGAGVRFGDDVLFAFTAGSCCLGADGTRVGGLVRVLAAATEAVPLYGPELGNSNTLDSNPFAVGEGAAFIHGNTDFSTAYVVDPSTLDPRDPIDVAELNLGTRPLATPSIAPREGGYLLLRGTAARFELLDDELQSLGPAEDLGVEVRSVDLVATCVGIVAIFATHEDIRTLAFDRSGAPLAESPEIVSASVPLAARRLHAVWDGAAITVAGRNAVIELDEMGALIGETPIEDEVLAALGTDDGLLVFETVPGSFTQVPRVVLRERETGEEIRTIGELPLGAYASSGGMGLAENRVHVVAASFAIRNQLRAVSIDCE